MWDLETKWYELIIRSLAIFAFLFVIMRLWGKKHFGELTPFDFIILLIISEAVQNALIDDDKGIPAAFISVLTLVSLNILMNKIAFHSRKAEKIIEGVPKVLIRNGHVNKELMKKATITDQELREALRIQGVMTPEEVFLATLETNGTISVIKNKDKSFFSKFFH